MALAVNCRFWLVAFRPDRESGLGAVEPEEEEQAASLYRGWGISV